MSELRLCLFGSFAISRSDGEVLPTLGKKAQALVAYIALSPERHETRERLAALLWGEGIDEHARHSLRQCLLSLRRALGDDYDKMLQAEGEVISLNTDFVEVDVHEFERLSIGNTAEDLETAQALYTGDLLVGLRTRAAAFDDWLDIEARRLHHMAADTLSRLVTLHLEQNNNEKALAVAQELVNFDPSREEGHRLLMQLYAASGQRAAALRQYKICEAALLRELDVEPDPETRALFEQIKSEDNVDISLGSSAVPDGSETKAKIAVTPWLSRRIAVAVVGALLIVAGVAYWGLGPSGEKKGLFPWTGSAGLAIPERPSIAILPFEDLNPDSGNSAFVDGLTEGITSALSMVSDIFVIARNTALTYRDKSISAHQVADELGVRYVLDGSVQSSGERVRVAVHLMDTKQGNQVWAELYDRQMGDAFALQDEVILEVITALQVTMTEGEQDRVSLIHGTDNLQAWMLAGQALQHLRQLNRYDNAKARQLYRKSIQLDPSYPGAWGGLAWTYFLESWFGWGASREAALKEAATLAQKTMDLNPERPRTFGLLGSLSLMAGDHATAIEFGEKAVALSPNGADVTALLALSLTYAGELERSAELAKQAMRLSPYYPDWYRWTLARAYRLSGDHEDALWALQGEDENKTKSLAALVELVMVYGEMGEWQKARTLAQDVLRQEPNFSATLWTAVPPAKDSDVAAKDLDTLVKAGLPQ